jgi:hypothetical protein
LGGPTPYRVLVLLKSRLHKSAGWVPAAWGEGKHGCLHPPYAKALSPRGQGLHLLNTRFPRAVRAPQGVAAPLERCARLDACEALCASLSLRHLTQIQCAKLSSSSRSSPWGPFPGSCSSRTHRRRIALAGPRPSRRSRHCPAKAKTSPATPWLSARRGRSVTPAALRCSAARAKRAMRRAAAATCTRGAARSRRASSWARVR